MDPNNPDPNNPSTPSPTQPIQPPPTPALDPSTPASTFTPIPPTSPTPDLNSPPLVPSSVQPEPTTPIPSPVLPDLGSSPTYSPTPAPVQPEPTSEPIAVPDPYQTPQASPNPAQSGYLQADTPSTENAYRDPLSTFNSPTASPPQMPNFDPSPEQNAQSSAPTDLSHLIEPNTGTPEQPTIVQPETLVVPTTDATPQIPDLPTEHHGGVPKWVIGLGVGLIIMVAGISAYFILGVGQQNTTETTSLPATQTPQTQLTTPPATVAPTPQPTSNPESSFGSLGGTPPTNPPATSAADLIRLRQQQQQTGQ